MGEKLMAQRALIVLRETFGKNSREAEAALGWARDHCDWLWPGRACASAADACATIVWDSLGQLVNEVDTGERPPELFATVGTVVDLLELGEFDGQLILVVAAFERLPRLAQLRTRLVQAGADLSRLLPRVAGASASSAEAEVRRSQALALGLLCFVREYAGCVDLQLEWSFAKVLDDALADEDRIVAALAGAVQSASLERADFSDHEADFDLLVRLLSGALKSRAKGVNILIYGPPGTGKTELARTLAREVGARLFAVGETDAEGDEPTRAERLMALDRAQRLLARRGGSLLLFDELEDLFAEASHSANGGRRAGSKIFINRLLERGAVPVIWTSNALDALDPAHLRRMSYVLRMGFPSPRSRARIAARAGAAEAAPQAVAGLDSLLAAEADSASIARVALRAAALAGGRPEDAAAAGRSLLRGMRGGRALAPSRCDDAIDLSLYDADSAIESVVGRITASDAPLDFSLLLSGPPGTGKTALAWDVARRLDRPLEVKRASDLLSKWVGGTEANIADAFVEARENGSVLLFDEADSLLLDRTDARLSWEITQVNELLTWMDGHPLPFIAATNFAQRLDPAAFRRFLFKVELRPLSEELLKRAFERFFDLAAPPELADIRGLTPGDFAVVKRQLRYRETCTAADIIGLLQAEAEAKPGSAGRIGF